MFCLGKSSEHEAGRDEQRFLSITLHQFNITGHAAFTCVYTQLQFLELGASVLGEVQDIQKKTARNVTVLWLACFLLSC